MFENEIKEQIEVTVLGKTFTSDEERRTYFREELRKKLPELKKMEGFPIGEDDDIINLSDPPYYTACPNPWLNDFIEEWESQKIELIKDGKRNSNFRVSEPYASDVSVGKNNAIYNAHSYHTKVPHPAIMRYILHYTQPGDIIFDGFAGTGMTGVASQLCGSPLLKTKQSIEKDFSINKMAIPNWGERKSICSDLSPIATFISSVYNTSSNLKKVEKEVELMLNELSNRFNTLYETKHSNNSNGLVNYYVWSEIFICQNCQNEFTLWDRAVEPE
ncbi:MAG: DNA methylase, partial [Acidimicrobiia bacterium]|nr:DNA methylase [Acidimicrobiia bacterium]